MKTCFVFFPFDLFGSAGTRNGADLLADAFEELLADNRRETVPTRARAYMGQVRMKQLSFDLLADYGRWRTGARTVIRQILKRRDFLGWISGNHLGVLPVYDELATRWPDLLVVQFDAHLDIYNLSDCTSELSHGNFLMHCAGKLPAIINVGSRELLLTPEHVAGYYQQVYPADVCHRDFDQMLAQLRSLARQAKRVFIDLDCDVFDAAYFPGLAHPQPLGLSPAQFLRVLDAIGFDRLAGIAVSEFDPARDRHDLSLSTLMWLLEHLLLQLYESPKQESRL